MSTESSSLLLVLLLCADIGFMGAHLAHKLKFLNSTLFNLGTDLGYAEVFQYIKYFWIVLLFIYIFQKTKCARYLSWSVVFAYFFLDDAFNVHERGGHLVASYIRTNFDFLVQMNLRLQDLGELTTCAIFGSLLSIILAGAYLRAPRHFKDSSKDILLLTGLLVFFGVFMDMVHSSIHVFVLGLIEEGGEMVSASLILWYVFLLALRKGDCINSHHVSRKPAIRNSALSDDSGSSL